MSKPPENHKADIWKT